MRKHKRKPTHNIQFQSLGSLKVFRSGLPRFHWQDLYHLLLTLSLPKFLGFISLTYFAINILFACAYILDKHGIENAEPGSFRDAFFFSVQTMATIGYGAMYPRTAYTHFLVTVEVFVGLLSVAMATGILFARFSRPTARVLFSNVAVVCPYNGVPTFMFRVANQRSNLIVEAQIRVSVLLPDTSPEGHFLRRLYDLNLVRSQTPTFSLSWMILHPIDETSPLYGMTTETLRQDEVQIVASLTGLDETVSQTIHARQYYRAEDVFWDQRFVDVLSEGPRGERFLNYRDFHKTIPFSPPS